jgi:hypothetical protein
MIFLHGLLVIKNLIEGIYDFSFFEIVKLCF